MSDEIGNLTVRASCTSTWAGVMARTQRQPGQRWSQRVTEDSHALDLERGVFTWGDPRRIARSLKRSALQSTRRQGTPYQSAVSMLTFYINRAGRQLTPARRAVLNKAKSELRGMCERGSAPATARRPSQPSRRQRQLNAAAFHEAGHAVVAHHLHVRLRRVSIGSHDGDALGWLELWPPQVTSGNAHDIRMADAIELSALRALARRLPEPAATLLDFVNDRDVAHLGPLLLPHVASHVEATALSPSRSPAPTAPVFLLHGRHDAVIPAAESVYLAQRLRTQRVPVRLLLTDLISHAEADQPARVIDVWRLAGFGGALLARRRLTRALREPHRIALSGSLVQLALELLLPRHEADEGAQVLRHHFEDIVKRDQSLEQAASTDDRQPANAARAHRRQCGVQRFAWPSGGHFARHHVPNEQRLELVRTLRESPNDDVAVRQDAGWMVSPVAVDDYHRTDVPVPHPLCRIRDGFVRRCGHDRSRADLTNSHDVLLCVPIALTRLVHRWCPREDVERREAGAADPRPCHPITRGDVSKLMRKIAPGVENISQ